MKQTSTIIKLLVAITLIVITPLLFFRAIGDNPFKVEKASAAQSIAIINEDTGVEEEGEKIQLGENVASILSENSNFEWTVVGRSAGENGLLSQKYDAVVYLPSNFSENVMSYDESNPVKTNFEYKVQSQLNAVNKEKVLLELEKATKKVNQKISTLYWNYVSADLENVRAEFDEILQKEIAFQEAMTAFYKPSSKDLAGQIEEQKVMLASLQSSIEQAGSETPDQKSMLETYEKSLSSFVEYVETYKEYQDNQQKILAEIQSQAIQTVSEATNNQQPLFVQSIRLFEDEGSSVVESMQQLNTRMTQSQQLFTQLEEQRYSQVARQISDYYDFQKKVLDFYQQYKDTLILDDTQKKLEEYSIVLAEQPEAPEEPTDPKQPENEEKTKKAVLSANQDEETQPQPDNNEEEDNNEQPVENPDVPTEPADPPVTEEPDGKYVNLEKEKAEIGSIAEEIIKLKDELASFKDLEVITAENLEGTLTGLQGLQNRLETLNTDLAEKETDGENPLQSVLDSLQQTLNETVESTSKTIKELEGNLNTVKGERDKLQEDKAKLEKEKEDLQKLYDELLINFTAVDEELKLYKDYEASIKDEINKKEEAILASQALSETRKKNITEILSKEINSKDLLDMMFYYSYLDRYHATLTSMISEDKAKTATLNDEYLQKEANEIVAITTEEQGNWDVMREEIPTTQDALTTIEDNFTVFMVEYRKAVDDNQAKLMESLDAIQQEAQTVLEQIQQPEKMLSTSTPTSTVEGQQMILGSEQISNQMDSIHTWLGSVQESQGGIVDYTSELQGRINDVQADADKLNQKWATNVASTELIRDDVFSVLGNAFVDGQTNGYVYDFLTNPLKISGDVPEQTESTTVKNIPPVVVLFIVLVSSLLIGYISYYFKQPPLWIQAILFVLLNLIVGFVISLFGLEIYPLREESAVEWTVFTIFLLMAGSALVRVGFAVHQLVGTFITVGMVIFYVTPLLALTTPNFSFQDPMSKVYMSIQYGTESLFTQAMIALCCILLGLGALQYFIGRSEIVSVDKGSETYDA
ncbi:type VII secretion protein EsaA [Metabacillus halosaccharovorans]|uniref:type VII secretion protein EsaA n=1 Tax=Metabacillus halosaccharovorans TaxID=930124 RepID=UPI00203F5B45|nr:type VII secretion protein EsaA [Metabacillus halosaccharovorans]MCM3441600.1 type VII secretion protein EsaA [Metabacillus halosaccharovorans]